MYIVRFAFFAAMAELFLSVGTWAYNCIESGELLAIEFDQFLTAWTDWFFV